MEVIQGIAAALAGFSITSAFILLIAYWFFLPLLRKTPLSKFTCASVLGSLMALQGAHSYYFLSGHDILYTRVYISLLMLVPLSFYLFSRIVLFQRKYNSPQQLLHFLPLLISFFLPQSAVPTLAFILGSLYTFWLASRLYMLRGERSRFTIEMAFFSMFAAMAAAALLLGLFLPLIDHGWFYIAYSASISIAMVAVVSALLIFPELLEDVVAVTERAYASTKLLNIDTTEKLRQLRCLMEQDHIYKDEDISLTKVGDMLQLSTHQVSELINSSYDKNFPRLVREYRVNAAKQQIVKQPNTSMLAIGLEIGFKSQSAFYSAFKEFTDMSPGEYRKLHQS